MINEIRNTIKEAIQRCSSHYKQIENPFFFDEDIVQNDANYSYHIAFGPEIPVLQNGGVPS